MKKYLLKFTKLSLTLFCLQGTIVLMSLFTSRQTCKPAYISAKDMYNKNGMIYIIGNSQPECAINDSLLPYNYINISQSAEPLFYSVIKARILISNGYTIDTIIINFTNNSLNTINCVLDDNRLLKNYSKYFSHMNLNEHKTLFRNNKKKALKTLLSLSPINIYNQNTITGGYLYLVRDEIRNPTQKSTPAKNISAKMDYSTPAEMLGFENLEKLIQKNPKTFFILTRMPLHKTYVLWNEVKYKNCIQKLMEFNNCRFIDFAHTLNDDELFGDNQHLNYKGAIRFTPMFFDSVRQNVKGIK